MSFFRKYNRKPSIASAPTTSPSSFSTLKNVNSLEPLQNEASASFLYFSTDLTALDALSAGLQAIKAKKEETKNKVILLKLDLLRRLIFWKSKKKPLILTTIYIDHIFDVRKQLSFHTNNASSPLDQFLHLSIHYSNFYGATKVMDLICPSSFFRDTFFTLIEELRSQPNSLDGKDLIKFINTTWIHRAWVATDTDKNGTANLEEIANVLKLNNVALPKSQLKFLFSKFDTNTKGFLTFPEFSQLCKDLKRRFELEDLFRALVHVNSPTLKSNSTSLLESSSILFSDNCTPGSPIKATENIPPTFSAPSSSASPLLSDSFLQMSSGLLTEMPNSSEESSLLGDSVPCSLTSSFNALSLTESSKAHETSSALLTPTRLVHPLYPSKFAEKMFFDTFFMFLKYFQNESFSEFEAYDIFLRYSLQPNPARDTNRFIDLKAFQIYLLSPQNSALNPRDEKVWMSMHHPLSHYFISSSHNTYLMGNQIKSESSVEGYIRVLQRGCRCVESILFFVFADPLESKYFGHHSQNLVDCWDGSNDEPVVYHGHTLTSKILFRDVIEVVKRYAFVSSVYPLILSLEMHCNYSIQGKIAYYLKAILGDLLVTQRLGSDETQLPSPESLKFRILVKGKGCGGVFLSEDIPSPKSTPSITPSSSATFQSPHSSPPQQFAASAELKPLVDSILSSSPTVNFSSLHHSHLRKEGSNYHPDLLSLAIYTKAVKFSSIEEANKGAQYDPSNFFCTLSSFSESSSTKFIKSNLVGFLKYHRQRLSRVYPSGSRVNSSNFDPFPHWAAGCQFVAMNWQTFDRGMDLNSGLFMQNGGCGYVLKPEYMIQGDIIRPKPIKLFLQILSAQQLPKPNGKLKGDVINPFVVLEILDAPFCAYSSLDSSLYDCTTFRTKTINNNGWNPMWKESFSIIVCNPYLTMLRFTVYDSDFNKDTFVASFCSSLSSLKLGYRHLQLRTWKGHPHSNATLFVYLRTDQLSVKPDAKFSA